jgi:hypothetical protein
MFPDDAWLIASSGTSFNSITEVQQPSPRLTLSLGLATADGRPGRIQLDASVLMPGTPELAVTASATVRGRAAALTSPPDDDPNGGWHVLEWDESGARYRVSFSDDTSVSDMIDFLDRLTRPDRDQIDQLLFGPEE